MKLIKPLAAAVIVSCFASVSAFAAPALPAQEGNRAPAGINRTVPRNENSQEKKLERNKGEKAERERDPIKRLQKMKERVQSAVKEGRLDKEKGDVLTAMIDSKIKEIERFNSLPVQQKKQELMSRFRQHMENKVRSGMITREKADELIKSFDERVKEWDGKGYPDFRRKGEKRHEERKDSGEGKHREEGKR